MYCLNVTKTDFFKELYLEHLSNGIETAPNPAGLFHPTLLCFSFHVHAEIVRIATRSLNAAPAIRDARGPVSRNQGESIE